MPVAPYLGFPGCCRAAMEAYAALLGGSLRVMTWAEAPPGAAPPGTDGSRVLHAELRLPGGGVLMGADTPEGTGFPSPGGAAVLHRAESPGRARALFEALAEGGEVALPFGRAFWSEGVGMAADRWGTRWIVTVATPMQMEGEEPAGTTS